MAHDYAYSRMETEISDHPSPNPCVLRPLLHPRALIFLLFGSVAYRRAVRRCMIARKAEIVSVLKKIKLSGPSDEAEGASRTEALPRNARLYFWRSCSLMCLAYLCYCITSITYDQGSLRLIEQSTFLTVWNIAHLYRSF